MKFSLCFAIITVLYTTICHVSSFSNCQDATDNGVSSGSDHQDGSCPAKAPPKIQISNGLLRGKHVSSVSGKPVKAFLGIPFAESPVGPLRFKRPVPYEVEFSDEFDATNLPNTCPQEPMIPKELVQMAANFNPNTHISEDCLYLNVWVPSEPFQGKRNVLYFIHGGGFNGGSISLPIGDGATMAAETNSIVVSSNYRLGPLGFLYLGTEDAPGNQGFLDQIEALKWIHKNIEKFGGDKDEITALGMSAGAMSVTFHLLSPLSQSLFKRAVVMSGVATAQCAFNSAEEALALGLQLAQKANCPEPINPTTAAECLRNVDSSMLAKLQHILRHPRKISFPMTATLDDHFLHDSPQNLVLSKDGLLPKDVLIGTTKDEGSLFLALLFTKFFSAFQSSTVPKEVLSALLNGFFADYNKAQRDAIVYEYQDHEHGQDSDGRNEQLMSGAFGDYMMVCPSKNFADAWSDLGGKVFFYYLTQHTESDPLAKWMGVKHTDDLLYFFGHALNTAASYTVEERLLSQRMLTILGNFARTGTPAPNWEPYSTGNQVYVDLNAQNASSASTNHSGPRARQCTFWNKFIPQLENIALQKQESP